MFFSSWLEICFLDNHDVVSYLFVLSIVAVTVVAVVAAAVLAFVGCIVVVVMMFGDQEIHPEIHPK